MEYKLCHNDSDFLGDDFNEFTNLIYIISDNGKVIYCYTNDDITGITKDLTVTEWETNIDRNKRNKVLKMPNENVWVDHVSIDLLKHFRSFILKKIRNQKIGSEFGVSNIHGEEYSLYRLIPVKRELINSVYKKEVSVDQLIKQKFKGKVITNIDIVAPSVVKFNNALLLGDVIETDNQFFINGTLYSDSGKSFKYKGKVSDIILEENGDLKSELIYRKQIETKRINMDRESYYIGQVLNDKPHGEGIMYYPGGIELKSIWNKGRVKNGLHDMKLFKGRWIYNKLNVIIDLEQPIDFTYFPYLVNIEFKDSFNQSLDNFNFPDTLYEIILGNSFNQSLDSLPRISNLKLGNSFNKSVDGLQLEEDLTIGNSFNQSVDNLPDDIGWIKLGNSFNKSVDKLPSNLGTLILGDNFNQSVDNLPQNLYRLKLGKNFNKSLDNLPRSLKELTLKITINNKPDGLKITINTGDEDEDQEYQHEDEEDGWTEDEEEEEN